MVKNPDCFSLYNSNKLKEIDWCNVSLSSNYPPFNIKSALFEFKPLLEDLKNNYSAKDIARYKSKDGQIDIILTTDGPQFLQFVCLLAFCTVKLFDTYGIGLSSTGDFIEPSDSNTYDLLFSKQNSSAKKTATQFEWFVLYDVLFYLHYNYNALIQENSYVYLENIELLSSLNEKESIIDFIHSDYYKLAMLHAEFKKNERKNIQTDPNSYKPFSPSSLRDDNGELHLKFRDYKSEVQKEKDYQQLLNSQHSKNNEEFLNMYKSLNKTSYNLSKENYNGNTTRYCKSFHPKNLISVFVKETGEANEYYINTFLPKFDYDLLRYSTNGVFNIYEPMPDDNNILKRYWNNVTKIYNNCSISVPQASSMYSYDYFIKKEYSMGLINLYEILHNMNRDVTLSSLDLQNIQSIPAVFTRTLLCKKLLHEPNLSSKYAEYFLMLHRLMFLMLYYSYEDKTNLEYNLRSIGNSFANTFDINSPNFYQYPYIQDILDLMTFKFPLNLDSSKDYQKAQPIYKLFLNLSNTNRKSFWEFMVNYYPKDSLPFT